MILFATLILYIVGARVAQHFPILKGSALLEIGIITTMTKIARIHWIGTAANIAKPPLSIPTNTSTTYSGAFQPSGNAAPPYLNMTLKETMHCNSLYPNKI